MRKPVPGFDGYEVDDQGQIWSEWSTGRYAKKTGVFHAMKQFVGATGYPTVVFRKTAPGGGKARDVHAIVLSAFVGPRPRGMYACHNNGIRSDNRPENLRWDTPSGNSMDRVAHGTSHRGSKNPAAKLTEAKVIEIKRRLACGTRVGALATEFGIGRVAVSDIKAGRTWAWLTC